MRVDPVSALTVGVASDALTTIAPSARPRAPTFFGLLIATPSAVPGSPTRAESAMWHFADSRLRRSTTMGLRAASGDVRPARVSVILAEQPAHDVRRDLLGAVVLTAALVVPRRTSTETGWPTSTLLCRAGGAALCASPSNVKASERQWTVMTSTEPFRVQRDDDVPGPWQVLAGGDRTGGGVMFGEARLPARTPGPGLHVHTREDEAAFVISGVVTFVVGDRRFEAGSGSLVWLPREVPHTFANCGDEPAWIFGTTTPAGLEAMFAEQAAYFDRLDGPPDPSRIREIGDRYGVRALGPPLTTE
jgi:mannose-6-phosphate isomerase-like protein (cupin superfamily)